MRATKLTAVRRPSHLPAASLPSATATWRIAQSDGPLEARVGAAIIAAGQEFDDPRWREWALRWLAGADRTAAAAHAAFAIADAEVEAGRAVPAPPAFPQPAFAARAASHLAIELARITSLRQIGEEALARSLEQTTDALASRLGAGVALPLGMVLEQRPRQRQLALVQA